MGKALSITHREFEEIAKIFIQHNKPLYLASSPGVGKSDITKKVARSQAKILGRTFVEWNKLNDLEKQSLLTGYEKPVQYKQPIEQPKASPFGSGSSIQPKKQTANPFGVKKEPEGQQELALGNITTTATTSNQSATASAPVGFKLDDIYIFADMRLSQKDSTDIGGMPSVDGYNNLSRWCPPMLMKVLSDPKCHGMLFLDELPNAPVLTQNAAYSLVLDRAAGELTFSKHICVFGAGNRVSDKSGVFERPAALKNRFGNYELKSPQAQDWITDYARLNNLDPRIIGFISFKPEYLNTINTNMDEDSYATPRSISVAATLINGVTDLDMCEMLVSGQCGAGFAAEFKAWCAVGSQLNIPAILANPSTVPTDMGARWFMIGALNKYVGDQFNSGNKSIIANYCKVLRKIDPDLQISSCYNMLQVIPSIVSAMVSDPDGMAISKQMQVLVNDK